MLKTGDRLTTDLSQVECVVESFVGAGGQGAVYRVTAQGETLALKWYHAEWLKRDTGLRDRLEYMIDRGSPTDGYLWPIELVAPKQAAPALGYLMRLRPEHFQTITALVSGKLEPSFYAIATAAFQLAHNFHELHALGLSYQDISAGNVFIELSGSVLISDCDNCGIEGTPSAIAGTPGFIAPEVMSGKNYPNANTDRFSLAVLLFWMLMLDDPFIGSRASVHAIFTPSVAMEMYCSNPVFVFDPQDESNRPTPDQHAAAYWPIYPSYVRDLFVKALSAGLRDPQARPYERKWRSTMLRMREAIFRCEICSAENFHDDGPNNADLHCWSCGAPLNAPLRLHLNGHSIVLNKETALYEHHLDPTKQYQFDRVLARAAQNPRDPQNWGLLNDSDVPWQITTSDGLSRTVEPRHAVKIAAGTKISFGTLQGEIVGD